MRRLLAAAAAALVLAGCGGSDGTVVVSAASSLRTAFEAIGDARYSFAGSDELAAQIRQGVRPDVFAAANASLPEALHEDGLVERPVVFAFNRLVLAVPAGATRVDALEDLEQPGIRVAIGSPDVPVGTYTREVLARLGAERARRILANVRTQEPDVSGVVGKLTQGAVDAGFVYITDVRASNSALLAIELPEELRPQVAYAAAAVEGAPHPEAAAEFVEDLESGPARRELEAAGFTLP